MAHFRSIAMVSGATLGAWIGWQRGWAANADIAMAEKARGAFVDGTGFLPIALGTAMLGLIIGALAGYLVSVVVRGR